MVSGKGLSLKAATSCTSCVCVMRVRLHGAPSLRESSPTCGSTADCGRACTCGTACTCGSTIGGADACNCDACNCGSACT